MSLLQDVLAIARTVSPDLCPKCAQQTSGLCFAHQILDHEATEAGERAEAEARRLDERELQRHARY